MPTRTESKAKKPTREDIRAAFQWTVENTNLVPTAWGPTASGKTYMMHQWAEEIGGELITVLLSQHTPDEIAGFQTEVGGQLVAQMPYWFQKAEQVLAEGRTPIILFDELGLAREEVRGAIYTFLRDREIHGHTLSGDAHVVAAMNPAVLAPPLMSRVLLIEVPADRQYLMNMATHTLAKKAAEAGNLNIDDDPAYSSQQPTRPAVIQAAAVDALNQLNASFWAMTEPAQRLVLQGLVPPTTLDEMLRDTLDVSVLARDPKGFAKAVKEMPPVDWHSIVDSVLDTLPQLTAKQRSRIMMEILDSMYDDIPNRLEPYYAKERDQNTIDAVLALDNELLWELISKRNFMDLENDELTGTAIDRWMAEEKKSGKDKK